MANQFKRGQKVVYPVYGVATIESIEKKEIAGKKSSFYILRTVRDDITVMVPLKNNSSAAMRKVISKKSVPGVFALLREKTNPAAVKARKQTWNKRHKEYSEKIKNGSILEIAEVFRDIFRISKRKDLAFGEKQIMENAFSLVASEIAVATSKPVEAVEKEVEKAASATK